MLLTGCVAAAGGVVRGIVFEHASGLPLARTNVRLQPIPKAGVEIAPLQVRAASSGTFVFPNVPDGLYLLIATREPYFPAAYGQRRPDGHGTPIVVTKDTDFFTELRMFRKGAITGRVLDENGIGMEEVPVVAYRARLPLLVAGRAISDDRGVYRIHGLAPGKYWVRTVAHTLDDGEGRLPTFGREGREIRESIMHSVTLDEDTPEADVRPLPGALFHLRGGLLPTRETRPLLLPELPKPQPHLHRIHPRVLGTVSEPFEICMYRTSTDHACSPKKYSPSAGPDMKFIVEVPAGTSCVVNSVPPFNSR